jgi:hypothetical protein
VIEDEFENPLSAASPEDDDQTDESRRRAIAKLAGLAVIPPTLMTLLLSKRASAESCGDDPLPPCPPT